MAGKKGFIHNCDNKKIAIDDYKKSLTESAYSYAQIDMIWDFYVTHSLNKASGQRRELTDYGWEKSESGEHGYKKLESVLKETAFIDDFCFIRAKTCKDTLSAMNLSGGFMCIEHPRAVALQNHSTTVDENENIKFSAGGENRIDCLFRHLRNSLAHGNTYFFDNGFVLLEDKDGSRITARILVKQQSLLDWIKIIDKDEIYYILKDDCSNCKK